jgi:ABC-2 type transport system ATP-binding protein
MAGLESAARRKAGGYSLGMRQRLGIAAALLGDPAVLIFDEPFNGMDPEGIVWLKGFLRSLAAEGRALLVSSHLMSELQDTADQVVIVGRGRVIADAPVADLIAVASGSRITVRTTALGRRWRCWPSRGLRSPSPDPVSSPFQISHPNGQWYS